MHQEPVYVDPDRTPPVSLFGEPEAVQIVAWNGCNGLVRQAEPFILKRVDYALCPILLHDTGIKRAKAKRSYAPLVERSEAETVCMSARW